MKTRAAVTRSGGPGRQAWKKLQPIDDLVLLPDLEIPDRPLLRKEDELRLGFLIQGGLRRLRRLLLAHPEGRGLVLDRAPGVARGKPGPEDLCRSARGVVGSPESPAVPAPVRRLNRILGEVLRRLERHRDCLILSNAKLVLKEALSWRGRGIGVSDLFQQGMLGLQVAVFRYDPRRGLRFSTYATYWILQSIRKCLEDTSTLIRVPHQMRKKVRRSHADLAPEEMRRVRAVLRPPIAFSNVENENGELQLPERIRPGAGPSRDPTLHTQRIPEGVREALRSLPKREKFILERKFGIGGKPETLAEIGQQLNLSRERIRQIKVEALARLKRSGRLADLSDALDQAEAAELN